MHCKRGRLAQCTVRAKFTEAKGSDNVSDHVSEKFYRRRKRYEKKKGEKQSRIMCSTGQPLIVSHCCKMEFTAKSILAHLVFVFSSCLNNAKRRSTCAPGHEADGGGSGAGCTVENPARGRGRRAARGGRRLRLPDPDRRFCATRSRGTANSGASPRAAVVALASPDFRGGARA